MLTVRSYFLFLSLCIYFFYSYVAEQAMLNEKDNSSQYTHASLVLTRNCFVAASLHCLTEKPAASSQKHMAEQRQRVVIELVNTERDYCNDLDLCIKHFLHELQSSQVSF